MIGSHSYRMRSATSFVKASGFTFLEVLIALCIVLIALVPLIQLHVTSIRMMDSSSRIAKATVLANARLAEVMATEAPDLGRSNGRVEEARGLTLRWRSTVTEADLPELAATRLSGIRRVQVQVNWHDDGKDAAVSVDTFVYVPPRNERKDTGDQHDLDRGKTITGRSRT